MFAWIGPKLDPEGRIVATHMRQASLPSLSSALLPVVLLMAVEVWPGFGAELTLAEACPAASAVLERFIVSQEKSSGWPLETIEIEASLPKLNESGRLRAIRRAFPGKHPDYKILEIVGDRTVKNQVIARYISADQRATDLPSSSVAMTPANYRFNYAGTVRLDNRPVYAFRMIPRKKRQGLFYGVLWLDSETGIAVRESGYMSKSPSVFINRVNVTRENELHNGRIEARITHVLVETRLVGRVQLIIVERPTSDSLAIRGAAAEE